MFFSSSSKQEILCRKLKNFRELAARSLRLQPRHQPVDPFGSARESPLRVNPEQTHAFRPGSRRVDKHRDSK